MPCGLRRHKLPCSLNNAILWLWPTHCANVPYPAPEMVFSPACLWEICDKPKNISNGIHTHTHGAESQQMLFISFVRRVLCGFARWRTASTDIFLIRFGNLWLWSLANSMIKGIRNESVCGRPLTALNVGGKRHLRRKFKTPPKWAFPGCWNICEVAFEWSFRKYSCSAKIHRT